MRRGPPSTEIGTCSCPLCNHAMLVKTNKHGYPAAWCVACENQYQPRSEKSSLLLLGRIFKWHNPDAAEVLIEPADQGALRPSETQIPPRLPAHLAIKKDPPITSRPPAAPATPATPAKAKRSTWATILDTEL